MTSRPGLPAIQLMTGGAKVKGEGTGLESETATDRRLQESMSVTGLGCGSRLFTGLANLINALDSVIGVLGEVERPPDRDNLKPALETYKWALGECMAMMRAGPLDSHRVDVICRLLLCVSRELIHRASIEGHPSVGPGRES